MPGARSGWRAPPCAWRRRRGPAPGRRAAAGPRWDPWPTRCWCRGPRRSTTTPRRSTPAPAPACDEPEEYMQVYCDGCKLLLDLCAGQRTEMGAYDRASVDEEGRRRRLHEQVVRRLQARTSIRDVDLHEVQAKHVVASNRSA
jgi:hypothetical protein